MAAASRRRWRSGAGIGLLLLMGLGSILAYAAVATTINGQASVRPFPGWVAVLRRGLYQAGDQVSLVVAAVVPGAPGRHPALSYIVSVCGSRPFDGVLLIGGAARLAGISTVPSPAEAHSGPPGGTPAPRVRYVPDLVIGQYGDQVFDLGPAQVAYITLSHPVPCAKSSPWLASGEAQSVSGRAAGAVQRTWSGPFGWWHGPHTSQDWPLVGAFPGPPSTDLGQFGGLRGLHGTWTRTLPEYIQVHAGGLSARAVVDLARPTLAGSSGLDWNSKGEPISPQARVTNADDLTAWEQDLLPAGIALGIGGALLGSLIFEWLRPRPEAVSISPPPVPARELRQLPATARRPAVRWVGVAALLVVAVRVSRKVFQGWTARPAR